jgi:hypothetical protein
VEVFSTYEVCSGTKVCPYYKSDYNAELEDEDNEEFHNQRAATFAKQAAIDELIPYLKTIAYRVFVLSQRTYLTKPYRFATNNRKCATKDCEAPTILVPLSAEDRVCTELFFY